MITTHMLKHAHRDKRVIFALDVPVIIKHIAHAIIVALRFGAVRCVANLLGGHIPRRNDGAIVKRHMSCQTAPSTSGFCHSIPGAQLKFSTDMIHLGLLRGFDLHCVFRKISAGVLHLTIQPQLIKIIADIIVVMNILARSGRCIGARRSLLNSFDHLEDALGLWRLIDLDQKSD